MIDYLEEVLEEEREETLSQSRRVAVRPRSGRPAGEPGTESAAAAGAFSIGHRNSKGIILSALSRTIGRQ